MPHDPMWSRGIYYFKSVIMVGINLQMIAFHEKNETGWKNGSH